MNILMSVENTAIFDISRILQTASSEQLLAYVRLQVLFDDINLA